MRIEEHQLWQIIIPYSEEYEMYRKYSEWENKIREMDLEYELDHYTHNRAFVQIACSETKILEVIKMTYDHFWKRPLMTYKVSGQCLLAIGS